MENIENIVKLSFLACVVGEFAWSFLLGLGKFNGKEVLCNLGILLGNTLTKPLAVAWTYFVLSLLVPLKVWELPANPSMFLLTFILVDFFYYWYHRLSHEIPVMWTLHHTHHSSLWMNLSTAVRLNWLGKFVSPVFYTPLVFLGFSPTFIVASLTVNLLMQFFLHTEVVGRLGWFEGKLLNTPSAHRVHHGSNPEYIDKNYAGVLIVWDRLFGTYEPEIEKIKYGVTTGFISHNPFVIQFLPIIKYLQGNFQREKNLVGIKKVR